MAIHNEGRDDVEFRFDFYKDLDPFPNIPPALLNSVDVYNYIRTIGMVAPFDEQQLNGITLSLKVGDIAVYWNEEKKKVKVNIAEEGSFILKRNTITFVAIKEELRLPAYIIARFNLRVTNAYRGILLGTGPIVDPGFQGRLYIPLHNLTNNNYVFTNGEPFIDMEFTKVSPNVMWNKEKNSVDALIKKKTESDKNTSIDIITTNEYRKWPPKAKTEDVLNRRIDDYFVKANQGKSIDSSLPELSHDTDKALAKVDKASDKIDTSLSRINVGLLFSFGALLGAIIAIVNIFRGDIKEIKDKKLGERMEVLERVHDTDINRIKSLQTTVDSLLKKMR